MIYESIPLKQSGSLPGACAVTYLISHSENIGITKRPIIVICPGGGYEHLSEREGEMTALQFNSMGYHAIVVKYSVAPAVYPTALCELASVIAMVYEKAEEWHIDTDKIVVQGCSAGGHLAASFCMNWSKPFLSETLHVPTEHLKPAGMMLNYPVITSGPFSHPGSFVHLLGERFEELKEEMSLEKKVNEDTPKAFVWHTFTDSSVPVENSLLLVSALKQHNISTEFHMYPNGEHGLGLANELTATPEGKGIQAECTSWIDLAHTWLKNL